MQWELTPWCPNACLHCYNFWRTDSNQKLSFTKEDHRTHKAAADEILRNHIFSITLTGGEPLAAIRQYTPYIEKLRDAGVVIHLNSTLMMLTPKLADLLIELNISSILVSLISAEERLHNEIAQNSEAYQKTLAGFRLAKRKGIRVAMNMVVTKKNQHTVRETGALAHSLGAVTFCATKAAAPTNCPDFTPYRLELHGFHQMLWDLLWVKETYGIKVDSLEHYAACSFPDDATRTEFGGRSCLAGKTVATIGFDGQIRPCSHAHLTYGNVANGLSRAWENMQIWKDDVMVPSFCKNSCDAFSQHSCVGGCRTDAYATYGDMSAPDPYCQQRSPTTVKKPKTTTEVPVNGTFQLVDGVMSRPEDFGHILFLSPSKWTAVDNRLYTLLRNGSFIVEDISRL